MTTPHELPALPVHKGFLYLHGATSVAQVFGYTAEQMQDYARTAIDHALARVGAEAESLRAIFDAITRLR